MSMASNDLRLFDQTLSTSNALFQDIFKVRGSQVSPSELESVLLGHPQILDVAVVGVPATSPATGEVPRAFVIRKLVPTTHMVNGVVNFNVPLPQLTEEDVKEWVAKRLAKYKALDGGVEFVDTIPRTASGKVLRRLLRERMLVGSKL
jgi:4-coumarate--CoA ligase